MGTGYFIESQRCLALSEYSSTFIKVPNSKKERELYLPVVQEVPDPEWELQNVNKALPCIRTDSVLFLLALLALFFWQLMRLKIQKWLLTGIWKICKEVTMLLLLFTYQNLHIYLFLN